MSNIIVYGAEWCADCTRTKYLFDTHDVAYEYRDIDSDPALKEEMLSLVDGRNIIPTVVLTDGSIMQEPSNDELMDKLGLRNDTNTTKTHDVVIVGAGPAALAAAIYTTREDIDTVLYEKGVIGGLAAITDWVDNYPGFPKGLAGLDLAQGLQEQAERFGAKIELGEVTKIIDQGEYKLVETTDGPVRAKAVLIATGSDYKRLGIPGEDEFYGRGVHFCATCDGAFYRDKRLVVVGGGNSAVQEAIFLTRFASHIDLLVRGDKFRASDVLVKELDVHKDKITVHMNTTTNTINGGDDKKVVSVTGTDKIAGTEVTIATDGVFIFIGLDPNTGFLKDTPEIKLDDVGMIETDHELHTAMPGVFAAGDVRSGATMQIASATGEGATAALMIRKYLEDLERRKAE